MRAKNEKSMGAVIIYCRHSPQRGGDESASCEVQEAHCEQHAYKQGWEVRGCYRDPEQSGAHADRPGLWAAIAALRRGDILLVFKHDRLARNVYVSECIRRAVEEVGGRIVACEGDIEGDGPEQVMIRQVLAAFAEYERKMIGLRTKHAMRHHQRQGRRMSGIAPYGYRFTGDRLEPVPQEQVVIAFVRSLHAQGVAPKDIRYRLAESEHNPRTARLWKTRDVARIIANL